MRKSKGAFKKWELTLMTLIIASGILLDYGNVNIVINILDQQSDGVNILKNFIQRGLHAIDYVEYKELK